MTAAASWNLFLVSSSSCSSNPASLCSLLDLCKENQERKTEKNSINLSPKTPLEHNGGHPEYQTKAGRDGFYKAGRELSRLTIMKNHTID